MSNIDIKVSELDNGISIKKADIDGIYIYETDYPNNKVYIYYSEIPLLLQSLRRVELSIKNRL